jgi:hypothetical protein
MPVSNSPPLKQGNHFIQFGGDLIQRGSGLKLSDPATSKPRNQLKVFLDGFIKWAAVAANAGARQDWDGPRHLPTRLV